MNSLTGDKDQLVIRIYTLTYLLRNRLEVHRDATNVSLLIFNYLYLSRLLKYPMGVLLIPAVQITWRPTGTVQPLTFIPPTIFGV